MIVHDEAPETGVQEMSDWRFEVHRLGKNFVSVARGPPSHIVDAVGEFKATLPKNKFSEIEWDRILGQPVVPFKWLKIDDLVPDICRTRYQLLLQGANDKTDVSGWGELELPPQKVNDCAVSSAEASACSTAKLSQKGYFSPISSAEASGHSTTISSAAGDIGSAPPISGTQLLSMVQERLAQRPVRHANRMKPFVH